MPQEFVLPDYAGGSLINVPPSIGALLGAHTGWRAAPLAPSFGVTGSYEKVVLLIVDGFGHTALEHDPGTTNELLAAHSGKMHTITSVAPSTTCVATTSLHTNGATPLELGTLGFTQFMPHHGTIGNMLFFYPAWGANPVRGSLEAYGITPETMMPQPSIYETLARQEVASTALMPLPLIGTPLSRMQFRGVTIEPYMMWQDLFETLLVQTTRTTGRSFHTAYITEFDSLGHGFGSEFPTRATLREHLYELLGGFLTKLHVAHGNSVRVLVTADHGMQTLDPERVINFDDFPGPELIHQAWAGEPRHVLIQARNGKISEAIEAIQNIVGDAFTVLGAAEAIAMGLYGPPEQQHPEAPDRLGDIVLLARGGASMYDDRQPHQLRGLHGSLTRNEMLVPLFVF